MRPIALLLLLPFCAPATTAHAQDAIHRCVDAHGNPVFTDQPCAAQQATPVQTAPAPAASLAPPGAPVPLHGCAATAAELRQRVIDAFAAHDPNRLAGLMLWGGYGNGSTTGDLRALAQLVRQPLLEIHLDNEPGPGLPAPASSTAAPAKELQLRTDDGGNASFAITRQAACLWLRRVD